MTDAKTSSAQLVQFYLDRIAAYDQAGPRVNAVLHINPNAAADARVLDEERKRRRLRGPLHGIPVLLKDNFDTKDMPTTGGALALAGIVPKDDAFQVRKLRDAGAVILGKVNLHELALGLTTVSSLGGQTLDPYDLTRAPGGSSGGSAVAATANFAVVTLGTDTSGSIRIPSSQTTSSVSGRRWACRAARASSLRPHPRHGRAHRANGGGHRHHSRRHAGYDAADPTTAASRVKFRGHTPRHSSGMHSRAPALAYSPSFSARRRKTR